MARQLSEDARRRIGLGHKGKTPWNKGIAWSEEIRKKLSLAHMGQTPWNKGKRGVQVIWNKGKTNVYSKERMEQLRLARKDNWLKENNPNWQGGVCRPYPDEWSASLRRYIRERDDYICQHCGKLQGDVVFHVHHIDENKKNCNQDNLITLCRACHTSAHNRKKKAA